MDTVDELARKLIEAFEPLDEEVVLEQVAIPEDLADPQGVVDLWVASVDTGKLGKESEEQFTVSARVSLPTTVALEQDTEGLTRLVRDELLRSDDFRQASMVASVASRAAGDRGIPTLGEAQKN